MNAGQRLKDTLKKKGKEGKGQTSLFTDQENPISNPLLRCACGMHRSTKLGTGEKKGGREMRREAMILLFLHAMLCYVHVPMNNWIAEEERRKEGKKRKRSV